MMPSLPYTDQVINNPNGLACAVLAVLSIDFSKAVNGRKTARTSVRSARRGETIETKNSKGDIESVYVTQAGDAVFTNLHNPADCYVAMNMDGKRLRLEELPVNGFAFVGENESGLLAINTKTYPVLHEIVTRPSCIKDAWGHGQHQFLYAGASLKINEHGRITGIDKEAFDATWELLP